VFIEQISAIDNDIVIGQIDSVCSIFRGEICLKSLNLKNVHISGAGKEAEEKRSF
jgi:hypothetical protein